MALLNLYKIMAMTIGKNNLKKVMLIVMLIKGFKVQILISDFDRI